MKNTVKISSILSLIFAGAASAGINTEDKKLAVSATEAAYHSKTIEDNQYIKESISRIEEDGWRYEFFFAKESDERQNILHKARIMTKSPALQNALTQYSLENQLNYLGNGMQGALLGTQVFAAKKDNKAIIAFRGTDTISNVIVDSAAFQVNFEQTNTGVHAGFYSYLLDVVERDTNFANWLKDNVNKDTQLLITGHSLGAAVATLMAAYLIEQGFSSEKIKLITFAEPAPGSEAFAERYAPLLKNYVWEANIPDPVVWSTAIAGDLYTKYMHHKVSYHHFGQFNGFLNTSQSVINIHSVDNYYNQVMTEI
ncbi:lipase family protein [Cysteiniphilum sp. JM-1]|uniref:lipase family protein n=1 Tax=Cysteiniphilum sp. JM-1 TaxID=2610891 RepID=UPI001246F11D|nr:lipase family protein [Cysteiniphilum sp. JM-1]